MNTIYLLPPFQFPTKLQKSSWSLTYIVFQSTTTYAENMLSFSVLCTSALSRLTQSIVLFCPRAYSEPDISSSIKPLGINTGLLIAVAPRYCYCSGATFTVAVAVAPLLLAESSGDSSAATFLAAF